jgi:hypothetical protein
MDLVREPNDLWSLVADLTTWWLHNAAVHVIQSQAECHARREAPSAADPTLGQLLLQR